MLLDFCRICEYRHCEFVWQSFCPLVVRKKAQWHFKATFTPKASPKMREFTRSTICRVHTKSVAKLGEGRSLSLWLRRKMNCESNTEQRFPGYIKSRTFQKHTFQLYGWIFHLIKKKKKKLYIFVFKVQTEQAHSVFKTQFEEQIPCLVPFFDQNNCNLSEGRRVDR